MPLSLLAPLLWLLCSLVLGGCGRGGSAATMPDGSKIAVVVIPNRDLPPEIPPERRAQLQDLLSWMEEDLIELLEETGYAGMRSQDPTLGPAPNRYLLRFQVVRYAPASRATRAFDPRNPSVAYIDAQFELIGPGNAAVTAGEPSAEGADWTKAARRVNVQMVHAANGVIRLAH